jgi:hypothetical protein
MLKVLILNLFIPVLEIVLTILEYRRVLPVKYRLMHFDNGLVLPIAQVAILIFTFALLKERKYRFVALVIFLVYIALIYFGFWLFPPTYLYD